MNENKQTTEALDDILTEMRNAAKDSYAEKTAKRLEDHEATAAENVVCRPYTLGDVFYRSVLNYDDDKTVKFMISNAPVNYYVQLNPFKTKIYKNRNCETVLTLYADDRDSGEFQLASKVEGKNIALFKDY